MEGMNNAPSTEKVPVGGTLIDRVRQAHVVEEWLVESGGEVTPELAQLLQEVEAGIASKVDGYSHLVEYAGAQAKLWSAKAERLQKIANGCNSFAEMLEHRIKEAMMLQGVTDLVGSEIRYKLQKTAAQLLLRDADVPPAYQVTKTTVTLDKALIRAHLKQGIEVPGAALIDQVCLRKYPVKGVQS